MHDRVQKELKRDEPDWRLKNCCPACTYKLEGEEKLEYEMLFTQDGNDSLKRIWRKEKEGVEEDVADNGEPKARASSERSDSRRVFGDYYLAREQVDRWSKETLEDMIASSTDTAVSIELKIEDTKIEFVCRATKRVLVLEGGRT